MKTVYLPSNTMLGLDETFIARGWHIYRDWDIGSTVPDLVCFTGGEDINPALYDERPVKEVNYWDDKRDDLEVNVYNKFIGIIPLAGVCRGGQLINVLKGGKLIQHDPKHECGRHPIITEDGETIIVSSVHHQIMTSPRKLGGRVIACAKIHSWFDAEVIIYPDDRLLCFQPHPEFGPQSCTDYFFSLVEKYC